MGRSNDPSLNQGSCRDSHRPAPTARRRSKAIVKLQLLPHPELSKNNTWFRSDSSPKGFSHPLSLTRGRSTLPSAPTRAQRNPALLTESCGDDGVRTRDLRLAKPALSQLSYIPQILGRLATMGVLGFEPRTSALSELRSSQLSYTPVSPGAHAARLARYKQKSQTATGLALSHN